MPHEFWIVVTEYDFDPAKLDPTAPGFASIRKDRCGPIVWENHLFTREEAQAFAMTLGDCYGWVKVLRVVP